MTARVPTGVAIVAWTWILTGALMVVNALLGTAAGAALPTAEQLDQFPPEYLVLLEPLAALRPWWAPLLVTQLVLGLFGAYVGVRLLALKPWARRAAQWLSWGCAGLTLAAGFWWLGFWDQASGSLAAAQGLAESEVAALRTGGKVAGLLAALIFAVPFIWMAVYLATAKARAGFSG